MRDILKFLLALMMCIIFTSSTSHAENTEENPFLDIASSFLENFSQGNGNQDLFSAIGNMMSGGSSKQSSGGNGELLMTIGKAIFAAQGSGKEGGGFNPMVIGSLIQQFMPSSDNNEGKSGNDNVMETIMNVASMFMANQQQEGGKRNTRSVDDESNGNNVLMDLLPMAVQALNSFSQPEMEKTEKQHEDHSGILPPALEKIHQMWDQFSNSEFSKLIFHQIGLNKLFAGFIGRDERVDYDKLFQSFQNQNFRRKWIKKAIIYLGDWAKYLSNAEIYNSYLSTGQSMINAFLQSQGFPKKALLSIERPSETLTQMINHGTKKFLNTDFDSSLVVVPIVGWMEKVLKYGKQDYLKGLNATEVSDSLTDTLNLEIIEPIAKVHRAYRFAAKHPKCDKYVICEVNSHDTTEKRELGNFKPSIIRFGSYVASWFISGKTQTSFWTLFAIANDPQDCESKFHSQCSEFVDVENSVKSEYIHTEL